MKETCKTIGLTSAAVGTLFNALFAFHYKALSDLDARNPAGMPYLSDALAGNSGVYGQEYFDDGFNGPWYSIKFPADMTAFELKNAMLLDGIGMGICYLVAVGTVILYNRKS